VITFVNNVLCRYDYILTITKDLDFIYHFRTLLALGYHVSMEIKESKTNRMKMVKLNSE